MTDRWIANASPVIALGLIDRLHLLTDLAAEVVVPPAVAEEVARGRDAASRALEGARATSLRLPDDVALWWLATTAVEPTDDCRRARVLDS